MDSVTPTGSGYGSRGEDQVQRTMRTFEDMVLMRSGFAMQWEEVARLILPASRNTFQFQSYSFPGVKKTDAQIDANGMRALTRFAAIVDSLVTPKNLTYHQLRPMDRDLWKSRRVRLWFEEANRILFEQRYLAQANFPGQQHNNYMQLGSFGTQAMFIDRFEAPRGPWLGLRYRSVPVGELFLRENHQGLVDEVIRWWRATPQQIVKQFGKEAAGESITARAESGVGSIMPLNMLHHCYYRAEEYDPEAWMQAIGKPIASCYVCPDAQRLLREDGYYSFPYAVGRYIQTPGEVYGRSPAMMVLPALKSLNSMKRDFYKLAHRKADPVLLSADDGLMSYNFQPGKVHGGGVNPDGVPLVHVLPTGDLHDSMEAMAEEKDIVDDVFLVKLFKMLEETKEMTATEVIERINEKGILMAPTVGRQEQEYLGGGVVERELDVLAQQHILPKMPPELVEAGGAFKVIHTSPLARAARAQEAAGMIRSMETVGQLVALTGDPSPLDNYDLDAGSIGIAEIQMVPEKWMASRQMVAQKRASRAKQAQMEQDAKMAPAKAAMMNAQVKAMTAQAGTERGVSPSAPFTGGR